MEMQTCREALIKPQKRFLPAPGPSASQERNTAPIVSRKYVQLVKPLWDTGELRLRESNGCATGLSFAALSAAIRQSRPHHMKIDEAFRKSLKICKLCRFGDSFGSPAEARPPTEYREVPAIPIGWKGCGGAGLRVSSARQRLRPPTSPTLRHRDACRSPDQRSRRYAPLPLS